MPRVNQTKTLLLNILDCGFDRASWHGANLTSALRGVNAKTAIRRVHGRKSIWEQLLHAAYWKQMVLNKLIGTTPFPRRGSNWIKPPAEASEANWKADMAMLKDLHKRLRDGIVRLPASQLNKKMIWRIHGVAAHDVYHAGRIKAAETIDLADQTRFCVFAVLQCCN
jgi:hypothetical protein